MDFLRELPDNCVDAVVTDPPYGIGYEYAEGSPHDVQGDDYLALYQTWAAEWNRITRVVVAFSAVVTLPQVLAAAAAARLAYRSLHCWHKPNGAGLYCEVEPVCEFGTRRAWSSRVWRIPCINYQTLPEWLPHPAQKPVALLCKIVEEITEPSQIVLDPFLGSGTTAVACERLGRKWIGCEINPEYAAMAEKRIARERAQLKLPGLRDADAKIIDYGPRMLPGIQSDGPIKEPKDA